MRRLLVTLGLILTIVASLTTISPASAVSTMTVSAPSSLTGGKSLSLLIRTPRAPRGGTTVSLTSSNRGIMPVPSSLTIATGRTSASVSVRTKSVEVATNVTVTVDDGATERTVRVSVLPAKVTAVSIPTSIVGGAAARGSVRLNATSAYPTTVTLTSADPSIVSVPASVTVKANTSSATFPVTTTAGPTGAVVITASANGTSVTDSTKVTLAQLSRVSLSSSISANATRTAKVYLTGPAPAGGFTASFASSDGDVLSVPVNVTVAAGQTYGSVQVRSGSPARATKVTVTARLNGVAMTKTVTVNAGPQPIALASVDGMPDTLISGEANGNSTVRLTKAASSATTVELSSGDTTVLTVPATVVVPAGRTSATFWVTAGGVTSPTEVTVTAKLPSGSKRVTLTVLPATLVSVETTAELASDSTATGTVTLAGIAPRGAVVTLTSSEPKLVQVPESLELGAGESGATFAIATGTTTEAIKFEITAYYGDQQVTFTGILLPAPVVGPAGFDPSSFVYTPDAETALTLLLTGPAPADGLTVGLEYSEGVSGDGKVWVEPGARSATVVIWVKSGAGDVSVTAYANDMKASAAGSAAETTATISFKRSEVIGGAAIGGTLTLSGPAGPDGMTIRIASNNPDVVPTIELYVAPGESSATFKVESHAVKERTVVTLSVVDGPAGTGTVTILPAT